MNRLILLLGIVQLLDSCKTDSSVSSQEITPSGENNFIDSAVNIEYPRREMIYTDTVSRAAAKIDWNTSVSQIICEDTIISYSINPVTRKVLRLCADKKNKREVSYLLLGKNKIDWNSDFGFPNEFTGDYLFSDVYRGGDLGGTITKFKFRIVTNELHFVDSITGGSYSEGAGTWEWLITNEGQHKAIVFHGGDLWALKGDRLLITPEESSCTYQIDLHDKDTILAIPKPDKQIYHQFLIDNALLFATSPEPRLNYLRWYDLQGESLWSVKTDYLQKIIFDSLDNLIIGSGYFFPKEDNTQYYFTIAYDKSGQIKWDFPTSKVYDEQLNLTNRVNTSNLFSIADKLYGMIVGQVSRYFGENLNHSNKLILFNSEGQIYETIDLSPEIQNYSVIVKGDGEFEIVSNYETRKFMIHVR